LKPLATGFIALLFVVAGVFASPPPAAAQTTEPAAAETALVPTEPGTDVAQWTGLTVEGNEHGNSGSLKGLAEGIVHRTSALAARLTRRAVRFIGSPYVFGGTTASGFDCSGYVQHVFAMLGVHLPRTADAQYEVGRAVKIAHVEPGDLVFFQTYTAGPSHVGIYLGKGTFVHSSSSRGVTVSRLNESYWSARYVGAKRVLSGG